MPQPIGRGRGGSRPARFQCAANFNNVSVISVFIMCALSVCYLTEYCVMCIYFGVSYLYCLFRVEEPVVPDRGRCPNLGEAIWRRKMVPRTVEMCDP